MSIITVTVGISGSGKSTWASDLISKTDDSTIRVNRNAIKMQLTASDSKLLSKDLEDLVTKIQDEQIRLALKQGYNVIIDNTNLKQKYINKIIADYKYFALIKIIKFYCDVNEAKHRVSKRDNKPIDTLGYINRQYKQYMSLDIKTGLCPKMYVKPYKYKKGLPECIICDLDGTLSLYDHKKKSPYNRDFENDKVNQALLLVLIDWIEKDNYLFFFSGRNSKFEKQTREFINKWLSPDDYTLIMREEKDMRRDSDVKLEMFEGNIRNKYNVNCVFDDRLQVIEEVWNNLGIFVFNCNQGNKRF